MMGRRARREREIARTREDILDAAARAFAGCGYANAKMSDIADDVGYTAASLYTYFTSKQEIFEALLQQTAGRLLATFDDALPSSLSFEQRVEMLLRRQLSLVDQQQDAFKVLLALRDDGQLDLRLEDGSPIEGTPQLFVERMRRWLEEHATAEDLGGFSCLEAAIALEGLAAAFVESWVRADNVAELNQRIQVIMRFFFYGVKGDSS